ncbi:hypothetical protein KPL74_21320 [Bacillus sp. NP157]|nr:hypothetical protein KPL74_21320 [Bacillus sp. NP157]
MTDRPVVTYESLKLFFATIFNATARPSVVTEDNHPIIILEREEAVRSKTSLMPELKQATSDFLIDVAALSPERRAALDRDLAAAGAPSVSVVRAWLSRKTGAVLKRGRIASDEEFQLVRNLLDERGLGEDEAAVVQALLDAYEFGG